jgi:hypothetical protein
MVCTVWHMIWYVAVDIWHLACTFQFSAPTPTQRTNLCVCRKRAYSIQNSQSSHSKKTRLSSLVYLPEIAADNRNNVVSFKGALFTNKGARALGDVPRGGRHIDKVSIHLLSAPEIISKRFATRNFNSALRVRVLPPGTCPPLTVAGFAVGYSLDVEDGVAVHPKTNPARNRGLERWNAGE